MIRQLYDKFLWRTPERYIEHLLGVLKNNVEAAERRNRQLEEEHGLYYCAAQDRYIRIPKSEVTAP